MKKMAYKTKESILHCFGKVSNNEIMTVFNH